ncbi:MAG: FRG domain-containing protein [Terriglobia bacterium]
MQTIDVEDWASYEKRLHEVQNGEASEGRTPELLFRGIPDSTLPLTTTLERRGRERMLISDYYRLIFPLKPQIETFTGFTWEIPLPGKVEKLLESFDGFSYPKFPEPATYSYMAHLRHLGFPSPLLDWTRSPYIAAFFAFRSNSKPHNGRVSIFAFWETPMGFKDTSSNRSQIRIVGPKVRTHRRHFLQQSDYTLCAEFLKEGNECYLWHFANHEEATRRDDMSQDVLWKFTIPWSERLKVLKSLDAYNLNAFSLFESGETLMETLAVREIEFWEKT